ncbi:hypothetical protein RKD40_007041 [Streptomyces ambofaciens]
MSGKLKGAITLTTPAGRRRASDQRASSEVSTSPWGCVGSPAHSKHSPIASPASKPALDRTEPASRTSQSSISAACSVNSSPARRSTAARRCGEVAAHPRWASAARVAARFTSAAVARPTVPSRSPVAGSVTGCSVGESCQPSLWNFPPQTALSRSVIVFPLVGVCRSGSRGFKKVW